MASAISDSNESDLTVSLRTFSVVLFFGASFPGPLQLIDTKLTTTAKPINNNLFTTQILQEKAFNLEFGGKVTQNIRNLKTLWYFFYANGINALRSLNSRIVILLVVDGSFQIITDACPYQFQGSLFHRPETDKGHLRTL